ncbi:biogenesis of lysosome-related organelles complex 1 subunit 2 isoform X1 [Numida meleagris]|uniref:biogenesis of lysosome-related organelles complex 1 subunit 2 isoform X1 n=1 Tax=Numida meleagris TaxID=8996 RepID=UPI000B3D9D10|nr:biogenesis of lysosome-related organelles complex 1 subunit 2 isoform X1 [Numida meleagris]
MATAAEGLPEAGAQPPKRKGPGSGAEFAPWPLAGCQAAISSRPREGQAEDPAVETAEEAKEPAEADINELCQDMFSKMATYLTGELTATSEDYKLLENMNKLTSLKYLEMKDIAINISRNLKDLNQKYAALQPYLEQINLIEEQVAALEQAAYKLDAYSKKLEAKYKKLEKR